MNRSEFGEILFKTRKDKGLSRKKLADDSGISYLQLTKYEQHSYPKFPTLLKLCEALGVTPNHFVEADRSELIDKINGRFNGSTEFLADYDLKELYSLIDSFIEHKETAHLLSRSKKGKSIAA